jgi:hypothetical protein
LSVQSADLRVIEWAFNQSLKDGYSASEFNVLAQEPVKAKPARYQARRIISTDPNAGLTMKGNTQ